MIRADTSGGIMNSDKPHLPLADRLVPEDVEDDPVAWSSPPVRRPVEESIPETPESIAHDEALNRFVTGGLLRVFFRSFFR
jgi:hypothetical protein